MLTNENDKTKINAIITTMIDGVIIFDLQGNIILANKAAESLFLVSEGALIGMQLSNITKDREISQMIYEVLETGNELFKETSISPSTQIFRVHVGPVKSESLDIQGAVAVFHDVTEARYFGQMRSEFAANVSHELRTPLTCIKGFVETLMDGAMENSIIRRRFLTIIDAETDRLSRLIEDLLTLSAIESKERPISPRPVCIVKSIIGVMNMFRTQISEKSLHVELIYSPKIPFIQADEDLLGQVIINLLDNAIKYTPCEGKIIIRCVQRGSRIVTTISDTGMGIPRESLPRVFERFYRVDKARSRDQGGTGLGLSIVKHIVESHGGDVFVDSEVGRGSTFGVSFLVV